ncbi:MAG: ADP-ribosylglycohydrolase family protein [Cyanobacteria bacterium P01_C01_bin.89]
MDKQNRFRGCLLGLAAGDAVGTTVEFSPRGTFTPLTDMVGGGPFRLKPGQWTDDTSMALCLATSLVDIDGFDGRNQMERYCRWWQEGYLSSTGECFDIGNATSEALARFQETGEPMAGSDNPRKAGNGSIMRLAPIPMFFFSSWVIADPLPDFEVMLEELGQWAISSSRTTHGAAECLEACEWYARAIVRALYDQSKEEILLADGDMDLGCESIQDIAQGKYRTKTRDEISGSGYVVKSLEAALWCFDQTDSFREAILMAANLGDDADTTAAVCGQIAGAFYGESGIPKDWLGKLAQVDLIRQLSDRLMGELLEQLT